MSFKRISCFFVLAVVAVNMAFGQVGATGSILGTITDSTGAVLPNVKVTVTNTATNKAFQTESNSAGDFNAPSLQPGTYSVSAEIAGFQKSQTDPFVLAGYDTQPPEFEPIYGTA